MTDNEALKALQEASGKVSKRANQPPSKADRKAFAIWLDPAVIRQIKQVCFEEDMTQLEFMRECINLGFAKYGKRQIA